MHPDKRCYWLIFFRSGDPTASDTRAAAAAELTKREPIDTRQDGKSMLNPSIDIHILLTRHPGLHPRRELPRAEPRQGKIPPMPPSNSTSSQLQLS